MTMFENAFHVHTRRCGHAQEIDDEAYVEHAISLGYKGIWFADHAPFPGDPFGNRMEYRQLDEYIHSLTLLKRQYREHINVHIGLEAEYLPSYDDYYATLYDNGIEFLALGQHIYETETGYNFMLDKNELREQEMHGISNAIIQGIGTGFFSCILHPDRAFRYRTEWGQEEEDTARRIISAAKCNRIPVEKNLESYSKGSYYKESFWALANGNTDIVVGLDAHSITELELGQAANILKLIRKRYDLSQKQLAARFRIPLYTLRDWERGRRKPPSYIISAIMEVMEYETAHNQKHT